MQIVNVGPEFDDFAEQVGGFLFPICHRLVGVGVSGCELCLLALLS